MVSLTLEPDARLATFVTNATALLGVLYLCLVLFAAHKRKHASRSATLVVLGDFGRSPRMMYHAQSLLDHAFDVQVIAYGSTPLPSSLQDHASFTFLELRPFFAKSGHLPKKLFVLLAPFKVALNALLLLWILFLARPSRFIMVQNPPFIPTLPVVKLWCLLSGSKLVIDWHNTGSSILAMRLGEQSPMVKLSDMLEGLLGRSAHLHLFVSNAMRSTLITRWSLEGKAKTFYDRPPAHFQRISAPDCEQLFTRLPHLKPAANVLLAVSSTSWTADEDFSLLLDALSTYERTAKRKVCIIITGKGPLRRDFERDLTQRTEREKWQWVEVRLAWLEAADYPLLLGAADIGISLHSSSSGFDLPMKVVDMFGAGLPVLALDFPALSELVQDGVNGLTFTSASLLALRLKEMATNDSKREQLRKGIQAARYGDGRSWQGWKEAWDEVVLPELSAKR